MNKENNLIEYKRELSASFERSVVGFLNSNTGGHIYVGMNDDGTAFSFTDNFMRTSFYFDDRKTDRLGDKLGDDNANGRWSGRLGSLEPGKGYIYTSSATEDRVFTFPMSTE